MISGNGRAGYTRSCSPNCRIFLSLATTLAVPSTILFLYGLVNLTVDTGEASIRKTIFVVDYLL